MCENTCCFVGHRKIEDTGELRTKVIEIIENLVIKEKVDTFLFGSKSDFDELCHSVVTELKEKYPDLQRRAYTCRGEACILEKDRLYWEDISSWVEKREVYFLGVEEEIEHKNKWSAGRASYVERNQAMIDDSDYCIFYYNPDYKPPRRKYSKRSVGYYQPKSGTQIAFDYAKRKCRKIINLFFIGTL